MQPLGQDQICNLALYNIGSNQINDISDDTPEAQACNMFWLPCLYDVYSEHQWAWSNAQVALNLLTSNIPSLLYAFDNLTTNGLTGNIPNAATIPGWAYTYAYPNNVVRIWAVYNPCNYKRKQEVEFDTVFIPALGVRAIVSNEPFAICDATYVITDPTIWDAKFAIAFSERLSAQISIPLTGDAAVAQTHLAVYNLLLAEAKRVGYSEQKKKPHPVRGYQDSRAGHSVSPGSGFISINQIPIENEP